jgi:hypothetical protein
VTESAAPAFDVSPETEPFRGNALSALRDPARRCENLDIGRRVAERVVGN